MSLPPTVLALQAFSAIQRGVGFLNGYKDEKTFGIEGCKLRLANRLYLKMLSVLLHTEKLNEGKNNSYKLFECKDICKYPLSSVELNSICSHVHNGFVKILITPKKISLKGHRLTAWWPYCSYCKPKGINCYISFSYDFLEFLAHPQIMRFIASKLQTNLKIKEMAAYIKWVDTCVLDPINQNILQARDEPSFQMEELIFREISNNLCKSKSGKYLGWPIVIKNGKRVDKTEDYREKMVSALKQDYENNNKIGQKLKYLAKINDDSEFEPEEAWRIDPLTTAFTIRFLSVYDSCESCKAMFGENRLDMLKRVLDTLIHLHEGNIQRNEMNMAQGSNELQQFDGTGLPLLDGGWMNAELPPEKDYALPDYSICSSIDILMALNSTRWTSKIESERIQKILTESSTYIIERLDNAINEQNKNSYIDVSHWDDRQNGNCDWSDIYCVSRELDFLLDYCLFEISNQPKDNGVSSNAQKILGTDIISSSITWLLQQQHTNGHWPKISDALLMDAASGKETQINHLFHGYLVDLTIESCLMGDTVNRN